MQHTPETTNLFSVGRNCCVIAGVLSLLVIAGCSGHNSSVKTVAAAEQSSAETQPVASPESDSQTSTTSASAESVESLSAVVDRQTFETEIRPFFSRHCVVCHGEETTEGNLRLDMLTADFQNRPAADHWIEVLDRLNLGEMPPMDEPRPDAESLARVIDWITSEVEQIRVRSQSTGGRVLLRRLTRLEYANTVRDLLDVTFVEGDGPLELLPPDGTIAGFDRVSKALLLDPSLMEAYLTVAGRVADRAVTFRPPLVPQRTLRFEFDRTPQTAMSYIPHRRSARVEGDFLVLMESSARTFGKLRHPYNNREIPVTGRYRIRVRAAADPGIRSKPVYMDVTFGAEGRLARFRVDARADAPAVYEFEKTFDAFTPGEFHVDFTSPETSREQLLEETRAIFNRLLPRAFRRPVTQADVQALVNVVDEELQAGAAPEQAIETALVAMLCAPDFLFLFEPSEQDAPLRRLNDHELASRLSYFLWSTMPDAELTRLADAGQLHLPEVLATQIDRMLADARVEGFVSGFARQWLKVDEFGRFAPDQQIYPDYYATDMVGIEADVKEEPLAFFREVLQRDESILCFLDSDWLMLNERLAKLYGISGVEGPKLRRVALPRGNGQASSERRGGLLGMAGVHLWGADGNRTKPVERGKYLLTVLFNDPPPPPPPNAGEVEPNLRGEKLTVRERLARHREQTTCNNCHRRIDPFGLAMENFNVIGQWRDRLDGEKPLAQWGDDRPTIDPEGMLPNGRAFADFIEFKQAIVEQQDRFFRALTEKLLTCALGRTIEPADHSAIGQILTRMQTGDPTLRTILKHVAASHAFQTK